MAQEARRNLPSVGRLLASELLAGFPHRAAVIGARQALSEARKAANGVSIEELGARAAQIALHEATPAYRPAVNCSGTILNTGLGRARLALEAVRALERAAGSHAVLELDLESGKRGDRHGAIASLLRELTGAEDAFVVNNNAAAVMLAVSTLASGGSVLLSRGQSVEIGGSFRMPDVVRSSGARLIDVGCTNITRAADYANEKQEDTKAILRCHPSNFAISGFSGEPSVAELAVVAKKERLFLIDDVGSGCLVGTEKFGLPHEPTIRESLAAGADVVTASGDKLLGGPQAGLIFGKAKLIARIRKNPLARAVRVDKLCCAALEATLRLYAEGRQDEIPTLRYLSRSGEDVRALASRLKRRLKAPCRVAPGVCEPGGGSLPAVKLPSYRISIDCANPSDFAAKMRRGETPVIGYVEKGRFWLDLRTVDPHELPIIERAVAAAVSS